MLLQTSLLTDPRSGFLQRGGRGHAASKEFLDSSLEETIDFCVVLTVNGSRRNILGDVSVDLADNLVAKIRVSFRENRVFIRRGQGRENIRGGEDFGLVGWTSQHELDKGPGRILVLALVRNNEVRAPVVAGPFLPTLHARHPPGPPSTPS